MTSGFKFALKEGASGLRRGKFHSFVVVASIALAVGALGFFYYGSLNLQRAARGLLQQLQFEAFISPSISEDQHPELLSSIQSLDARWKITYVSKADAAARFRKEFDPLLFDVLKENPLPASFQVSLPPQALNPVAAREAAQRLHEIDGIDEVVYDQDLLALYQTGQRKLGHWGMVAGGLAVLLALGLTYNAVRLKIDHQHEAVRLMSLLGATPAMLRGLYWVQGAILGGIGGLAGALLLSLLTTLVATRIATNLNLVEPSVLLCGLTGAVLGVLGGVLAVGRYLKV